MQIMLVAHMASLQERILDSMVHLHRVIQELEMRQPELK